MTCWFCGKEPANDGKAFDVEMFGEVAHTRGGDSEEAVSFNKKLVVVPRCASCAAKQKVAKVANVFTVIFLVLALASLAVGWFKWLPDYIWGIALGFSAGMVIEFLTVRGMSMKGTRSEHTAKRRYKDILDLKKKGYQFGRAPVQHKVNTTLIEED